MIEEYSEEKSLLKLSDEDLDKALGLCAESEGAMHPKDIYVHTINNN